jgi:hypothetical protein
MIFGGAAVQTSSSRPAGLRTFEHAGAPHLALDANGTTTIKALRR